MQLYCIWCLVLSAPLSPFFFAVPHVIIPNSNHTFFFFLWTKHRALSVRRSTTYPVQGERKDSVCGYLKEGSPACSVSLPALLHGKWQGLHCVSLSLQGQSGVFTLMAVYGQPLPLPLLSRTGEENMMKTSSRVKNLGEITHQSASQAKQTQQNGDSCNLLPVTNRLEQWELKAT